MKKYYKTVLLIILSGAAGASSAYLTGAISLVAEAASTITFVMAAIAATKVYLSSKN